MVYLANKPMMEHILNLLKRHNLIDIVALLYFQPEEITSYFGDGKRFGVNLTYVSATADYGTAGSVRNARDFLNDRFLIISGDVLTDIDLSKAIQFHIQKNSLATMVLTRLENPLPYGVVIIDRDGRITRFLEKPSWGEVFSDTVNTGIYILEPEVLNDIPYQEKFDFSKDLFPWMLNRGKRLFGYVADEYWKDVGNLEEYARAHQDVLEGQVKIDVVGNLLHRKGAEIWAGKNVEVSPEVEFKGKVILGNNVSLGSNSLIYNSIIGDRVKIGEGVKISRSVIWRDTSIGHRAVVNESTVCNNAVVEDGVLLSENSVISEDCRIGSQAEIRTNV